MEDWSENATLTLRVGDITRSGNIIFQDLGIFWNLGNIPRSDLDTRLWSLAWYIHCQ